MAASAMAYAYGVPIEVIRKNLLTFPGVEHRIEFVAEKEVSFIIMTRKEQIRTQRSKGFRP